MKVHIHKTFEDNKSFGYGISEAEITDLFISNVNAGIAVKEKKDYLIARYDKIAKQAYLESSDGKRE